MAEETEVFLLQMLRNQIKQRVYPVHRLDRKTCGVILFALNKEATSKMAAVFKEKKLEKEYIAVVRGYVSENETIDYGLKREGKEVVQDAITTYKRLHTIEWPATVGRYPTARYSLVKVYPKTGRMHQIRRHFSHIRHPIIGDHRYGDIKHNKYYKLELNCPNMLLFARKLRFFHPYSKEEICIQAAMPAHLSKILQLFKWQLEN